MGRGKRRIKLMLDDRICDYGCGGLAHYEFNNGKVCCSSSYFRCLKIRKRISQANMGNKNCLGNKHTKETKEKMRRSTKGISEKCRKAGLKRLREFWLELNEEERKRELEKRGFHKKGAENFFYGCKHSETTRAIQSKKAKKRIGIKNSFYGKHHSAESRRQMRISRIKYIGLQYTDGGQIYPTYNLIACKFFEQLDKDFNTRGQYATNGGEYNIKSLVYWVDYINFDLKLIIEWDEERHYDVEGNLKEGDVERQKEIQEYFPDFMFLRIREKRFQKESLYDDLRLRRSSG